MKVETRVWVIILNYWLRPSIFPLGIALLTMNDDFQSTWKLKSCPWASLQIFYSAWDKIILKHILKSMQKTQKHQVNLVVLHHPLLKNSTDTLPPVWHTEPNSRYLTTGGPLFWMMPYPQMSMKIQEYSLPRQDKQKQQSFLQSLDYRDFHIGLISPCTG